VHARHLSRLAFPAARSRVQNSRNLQAIRVQTTRQFVDIESSSRFFAPTQFGWKQTKSAADPRAVGGHVTHLSEEEVRVCCEKAASGRGHVCSVSLIRLRPLGFGSVLMRRPRWRKSWPSVCSAAAQYDCGGSARQLSRCRVKVNRRLPFDYFCHWHRLLNLLAISSLDCPLCQFSIFSFHLNQTNDMQIIQLIQGQ
jgi:hypothetical protein